MSKKGMFLSTCNPDYHPMASSLDLCTPRRAIDLSGRLGSLYDASRDKVLHNLKLSSDSHSIKSRSAPECYAKTCTTAEGQNLLKWYHIHPELRLSVALEMIPATGVGRLINYSRPIDQYTRFICYNYISRTEYLSDDDFKSRNTVTAFMSTSYATHVIVLVNYALIWISILQLPPDDELVPYIDSAISKLCRVLSQDPVSVELSRDDMFYLEKIVHTEIFSNRPGLSTINSIIDLYHDIPRLKKDTDSHEPYNYNLWPIQYFRETSRKETVFTELREKDSSEIEDYVLQLSLDFRRLTTAMNQDYPNLQKYVKHKVYEARTQWSNLKAMHTDEIDRLQNLVIDVRRGKIDHNTVHGVLNNNKKEELLKNIDDFKYHLNAMEAKEHLISDLSQKHFEYKNAIDLGIKKDADQQALQRKLLDGADHTRIICFDDNLYKTNNSQWYIIYSQLLREREENHQLRCIYVDFTDCSYKLNDFIIFPAIENSDDVNRRKSTTATPSEQSTRDDVVNILLIGESGVGKSTFINAFVNYFQFDTLEQAQKNPVVLMPVSFVMTVGDDFKERLIKFGGQDNVSNEDYDHPGQSVTQHCKSYVFIARNLEGRVTKVRLIDTPGIGDIRGLAQDDINMQHILSFVNNLTHLNAICILMKPNCARLNIFFRSCFMQLFDFLGEDARDKIIFCFTNTRATFYTPGDTAPLLKELLKTLPVKGTSFNKYNTYCFDSESFRYLVAVRNGIEFEAHQKQEYEDSWKKSSTESRRFLEYVHTGITTSLVPGEIKSIKHIQLRICSMIRPMLEAMRNIARNMILQKNKTHPVSIELCPSLIKGRTAICLSCRRSSVQFDDFWINTDGLHVFYNRCRTCACPAEDHYPIDYELQYKLRHDSAVDSVTRMSEMLDDIFLTCAQFGDFLSREVDTSKTDLFLSGLNRMTNEEYDICAKKKPAKLNSSLLNHLEQFRTTYIDMTIAMLDNNKQISLLDMYDKIENMNKYPMIESQMAAVKQWEKYMVKYYEYEVPM